MRRNILSEESKKDKAAKQLKDKFQQSAELIDKVLDADPTGSKYIDFISKNLEELIKRSGGEHGGLINLQSNQFFNMFNDVIPWFEKNSSRIDREALNAARDRFLTSMDRDVDNFDKIVKSPRDITNYNVLFLQMLKEVVNYIKTRSQLEAEAKSRAVKVYEDDEVLVVSPKSYEASCYYGANTKWCTASSGHRSYFDKYNIGGNLYYFINKKTGLKMALVRGENNKTTEVYDQKDNEITLNELRSEFPNQTDLIDDIAQIGSLIKALRQYVRGKITDSELEESDDALIFMRRQEPLGNSIIDIDFDDEEKFYDIVDIEQQDRYLINSINSSYSNYELYDSYTAEQDFLEGYVVYYDLNESNMTKLKAIAKVILPQEEFRDNSNYFALLSERLQSIFPEETDRIVYDYQDERDMAMSNGIKDAINKDLDELVEKIGFSWRHKYSRLSTTPANLIMWAARYNITKTDAITLFKTILEKEGLLGRMGGWNDDIYSYEGDFDTASFNDEVERQLDSILEKIEDECSANFTEYLDMVSRITKKFKIDKWYNLPKDKNISFKIDNFDLKNMEIDVLLQKSRKGIRKISVSEEDFNHLLYQPELFDMDDLFY
jgi:hypothetical protein